MISSKCTPGGALGGAGGDGVGGVSGCGEGAGGGKGLGEGCDGGVGRDGNGGSDGLAGGEFGAGGGVIGGGSGGGDGGGSVPHADEDARAAGARCEQSDEYRRSAVGGNVDERASGAAAARRRKGRIGVAAGAHGARMPARIAHAVVNHCERRLAQARRDSGPRDEGQVRADGAKLARRLREVVPHARGRVGKRRVHADEHDVIGARLPVVVWMHDRLDDAALLDALVDETERLHAYARDGEGRAVRHRDDPCGRYNGASADVRASFCLHRDHELEPAGSANVTARDVSL
eukprot:2380713-Pleurochrysis_carterae.AAC.2